MLCLDLDDEYKWYQSPKQNDDNYLHFMSLDKHLYSNYYQKGIFKSYKNKYDPLIIGYIE